MSRRTSALALLVITRLVVPASAHADEPASAPSPSDLEGPPRPPSDPPAPADGPPAAPPDAPAPPVETEGTELPGTVTPRPTEAPVESEPELVPPRFGAPGQWVLMSDFGLDVSFTAYSGRSDARSFGASVQPAFDVFVAKNFSVGLSFFLSHRFSRGYLGDGSTVEETTTSFGAGPRVGYVIPLSRWLSLYPRVTFGFSRVHAESRTSANQLDVNAATYYGPSLANNTSPYVYAIAPLLLHPSSNFFVGMGPSIFQELPVDTADGAKPRTSVALATVVGGTWGGDPVPPERAGYPLPSTRKPTRYRFGNRDDILLGGDFLIGASYSHVRYTSESISISPRFDYFVVDHVSLGAGAGVDLQRTTFGSGSFSRTISSSVGVHVLARVGVQATLSERLSFYPRAIFRVSYADISAGTAGREDTTLRIALDLPFVFHAAPHFYVGCGPYVGHDIARSINGMSNDVLGTTGGVSTLVGGWL